MRKWVSLLLIVGMLVLGIASGCSTQTTKSSRTETTQYHAGSSRVPGDSSEYSNEPVAVERQSTETTQNEGDPGGFLSGAVRGVGKILALPFRLVGGVIEAVF